MSNCPVRLTVLLTALSCLSDCPACGTVLLKELSCLPDCPANGTVLPIELSCITVPRVEVSCLENCLVCLTVPHVKLSCLSNCLAYRTVMFTCPTCGTVLPIELFCLTNRLIACPAGPPELGRVSAKFFFVPLQTASIHSFIHSTNRSRENGSALLQGPVPRPTSDQQLGLTVAGEPWFLVFTIFLTHDIEKGLSSNNGMGESSRFMGHTSVKIDDQDMFLSLTRYVSLEETKQKIL